MWNPSLDPDFTGGGGGVHSMDDTPGNGWCVHLWEGGRLPPSTIYWQALTLTDPLWTAARVRLDAILFSDEAH